jgi:hypothetical protein
MGGVSRSKRRSETLKLHHSRKLGSGQRLTIGLAIFVISLLSIRRIDTHGAGQALICGAIDAVGSVYGLYFWIHAGSSTLERRR